jgi:homoserine kinase
VHRTEERDTPQRREDGREGGRAPAAAVRAFAPATVANLGPGFDILGLALARPGDVVVARRSDEVGVRVDRITGDGGALPLDPERNTAGIAAQAVLELAGVDVGIRLELEKGLPIGSGLGSSASSAAAAAFAVNRLIGNPLRRAELVGPCVEAEAAVSGRHADNVAPALLGGLILVRGADPADVVRLPVPEGLSVVVATPEFELCTHAAREALPDAVPLAHLVSTTANVASLVSALYSGDLGLFGRAIQDPVVTPCRCELIPGASAAIEAALSAGALGSSISGSGPSVFAFCRSERNATEVGVALRGAFEAAGLESSVVVSPADCPGARAL